MNKRLVSLFLVIVLCMMPFSSVFATYTPSITISDPGVSTGSGNIGGIVAKGLGLVKYIGYAVAIAMVMFAGIKYLTAGVGEKAQVKSTLIPMLAGAIMVVAATSIVSFMFGLGDSGTTGGSTGGGGSSPSINSSATQSRPSMNTIN